MWSSKQPNSGTALLGKNGRRCKSGWCSTRKAELIHGTVTIKSVLDVKDDKAPPKSATGEAIFDRSILILAPERALKFTAPNKERHYLWLTALSFLAQSGRGPPQVPRLPIKGPAQTQQTPPFLAGQHGPKRDAVGKEQATVHRTTANAPTVFGGPLPETSSSLPEPLSPEAAEPPVVHRGSVHRHQRKRSTTNPGLPPIIPTSLRSFSANAVNTTMTSVLGRVPTNTSSSKQPSYGTSFTGSPCTSVVTPEQPNFFEAMGTVRMEAFVDPNYHEGVLYVPPLLPPKRNAHSNDSIKSTSAESRRKLGYVFDEIERDPFTGF